MKKDVIVKYLLLAIPIVLCVLLLLIPLCELIAMLTDTEFTLYSELTMDIIQVVLSAGGVAALFVLKPKLNRVANVFAVLLLPAALLNALCFVDPDWGWSILFAAAACGAAIAIFSRFAQDSTGKAIAAVASVLLGIAIVVLYLYNLVYNSFFSDITVKKTVESPEGTFVAEVVTDANILGDKTRVFVRRSQPNAGALIGSFSEKSKQLYSGEEYEIDTVKIIWEEENLVVINGNEHEIDF